MSGRWLLALVLLAVFAIPVHPSGDPVESQIAAGKFLIASDFYMSDPKFQQSVILLVRHDPEKGTLGLILNHPTKMNVHEALPGISEAQHLKSTVYIGGPVGLRDYLMLVRTNQPGDGLIQVLDNCSFSADIDTISTWLPKESKANRIRIFAGYSGWAAGQLAMEIQLRGWHLVPADAYTVFDIEPEKLWSELSKRSSGISTSIHNEWLPVDPLPPRALQATGRLLVQSLPGSTQPEQRIAGR